jgi:TRAP-type C4-dicarboxylate transport system permease small subunit
MEPLTEIVRKLTRLLNAGAITALVFMMCLTVMDVILRAFGRPIPGTFELVAFSGAVVLGLANPLASWARSHVQLDTLLSYLPKRTRKVFNISTRCLAIWLFFMIGWNLIQLGIHLRKSGEISPTLTLPFYPVAYGIGVSAFIQCLVFVSDIFKVLGGKYE